MRKGMRGPFDIPTSPRQFYRDHSRNESRLEKANEALAAKDLTKLRWLHPTKGWRSSTHSRMRAALIYNSLKTGELPFLKYLQAVAKGLYRGQSR